ncbi:MAG TPA: hypothetical protein VK642_14820 [Burkholderiales bacterium]|nr:hypothetical protein [Burkholderiales bacterium]
MKNTKSAGLHDLKSTVLEIAEIAKQCPENLQTICFEILLRQQLGALPASKVKDDADKDDKKKDDKIDDKDIFDKQSLVLSQDDLLDKDLHVKVKHFMKKNEVTLEHLNNLFYKEEGTVKTLYEDLKSTRLAESQIRVALLLSLQSAISNGEFKFETEAVRAECNTRKCLDKPNFAANFKNRANYFDGAYEESMKLSEEGRIALAALIKQLQ